MSQTERKNNQQNHLGKRKKKSTDDTNGEQQSKRLRKEKAEANTLNIEKNLPKASILQTEEKSFPRGGASVLTPFERKQIHVQAAQDVLFEDAGHKEPQQNDLLSDDDQVNKAKPVKEKAPKKARNPRSLHKPSKSFRDVTTADSQIKSAGLKLKRLVPGSMILGQVSRIATSRISLDLPNNLTGTVSIASVSPVLSHKLDALALNEDTEDDAESQESKDVDVDLSHLFHIGQYLRTYVISTSDESSAKAQRKIQLSVEPKLVNQGIEKHDIAENCMLQASVTSVEDHGLVMDLGLQNSSIKGFMSSREIPQDLDYDTIKPGMVFLCLVTGLGSNSNVIKLSSNMKKTQSMVKSGSLSAPPTVKSLLPGMAAEILVSKVSQSAISGQIMGSVSATADIVHLAPEHRTNVETAYRQGDKLKCRIIFTVPGASKDAVGVSVLEHILSLSSFRLKQHKSTIDPLEALPTGSIVTKSKVLALEPGIGLFLDVGIQNIPSFVHSSHISDHRVESLSATDGPYRVGTVHSSRIVGYNTVDNMFIASMQNSVLEQKYLRLRDVPVGEILQVTVLRLAVNSTGVSGLLVKLANGINGFISETHMSDIQLQHPERKFKEGMILKARVLSVDAEAHRIRLTLKKTLLSPESPVWTEFAQVIPGAHAPGTIIKIGPEGAHLKFFGHLRAFLPVSEMSDAFVEDPSRHFRVGQAVKVHVLTVDPTAKRMVVSCKIPSEVEAALSIDFATLHPGQLVTGVVTNTSEDGLSLQIKHTQCQASIRLGHLTDGSRSKDVYTLSQIRIGLTMQDLVIVEVFDKTKSVALSNKPSLVRDARQNKLLTNFDQLVLHGHVHGYVRNITEEGIFVGFAGNMTGLLHRTRLPPQSRNLLDFGYTRDQSISAYIAQIDSDQNRFNLTLKEPREDSNTIEASSQPEHATAVNPVEGNSQSLGDFKIGTIVSARIASVKSTQLNVKLAENVFGRVDASEAFSRWEDIKDRQKPLKAFKSNEIIQVRILGIHDARNHRFLPISHRSGQIPVFELSAKLEENSSILALDQLKLGSWYTAFVNNIADTCLWMNLSPNVRGRIEQIEVSEDVSMLNDLEANFPVGSALRVRITNIDSTSGHLDLSSKTDTSNRDLTFDSLVPGMIVTGRVTKTTERLVLVQLGPAIAGAVELTELADDFSLANPFVHNKNDIIRVSVLDVDKPNKRISLSTRPSKVLSSSLHVTDRHVSSLEQLHVNDRVRGFIKNVADTGLFVSLSHSVTAFIRVPELSDSFLKDWKSHFEIDRLVTGRIISIDPSANHVQMTLKNSVVSENYIPPVLFNDLSVGQVITGKIRKVEDFGAFIVVDNSQNVSGLCHRSEMANKPVPDARKIYEEGDKVKAIVLKIDPEKRRISFGLKASYFETASDDDSEQDEQLESEGSAEADDQDSHNVSEPNGVLLPRELEDLSDKDSSEEVFDDASESLDAGGFDWTGGQKDDDNLSNADSEQIETRRQRGQLTSPESNGIDLDAGGPQSGSDFERLLLGQRDSSSLWIQYVAFHLQLGEVDEARQVAERALREINIREQEEKMNVWIAYLNLENAYGSDDSIEEVFTRACEYTDPKEMHERLASIYIESGKNQKANNLFQTMARRKSFTSDPNFWLNYATFLFDTLQTPPEARALLDRAMQSVPESLHRDLVSRFAQLEFKCSSGDPERGRTMFTRLTDTYPKRWDLWDVWVDMERGLDENVENVRELFEQMTQLKMKNRRAKFVFRKWLEFEDAVGNQKMIDKVTAKAREFVERQSQ